MEVFLIKAGQLLLSLTILIVLHEFGHFITAKWFKVRVERFYIFFNPFFSIFKYKPKKSDTTYGIGWLPLGGYVKLSGMIDESMDKDQMKEPPKPYEFRSKPAWQRLIIMLGGIIVNVILAWVILAFIFMSYGDNYLSVNKINETDGFAFNEVGKSVGFKNGDKILSVDGEKHQEFKNLTMAILFGRKVQIDRNGELIELTIKDANKAKIIKNRGAFISQRILGTHLDSVLTTGAAYEYRLQKGDIITSLNGQDYKYFDEFRDFLKTHAGDSVSFEVLRGEELIEKKVVIPDSAILGFECQQNYNSNNFIHTDVSVGNSFPMAVKESWNLLTYHIKSFILIFQPETKAYTQVGSVLKIGEQMPSKWNWQYFWWFTAMFSIYLAFFNLLPIPGLDGGYVFFLIIELISGKKVKDEVIEKAVMTGFFILMGLFIFLTINDISNLIA